MRSVSTLLIGAAALLQLQRTVAGTNQDLNVNRDADTWNPQVQRRNVLLL